MLVIGFRGVRKRVNETKVGEVCLEVMDREGASYLEEAWGHGTTWHGVVGWHVAHYWAGRSCCALKDKDTVL